jgi:hypothetical protein
MDWYSVSNSYLFAIVYLKFNFFTQFQSPAKCQVRDESWTEDTGCDNMLGWPGLSHTLGMVMNEYGILV